MNNKKVVGASIAITVGVLALAETARETEAIPLIGERAQVISRDLAMMTGSRLVYARVYQP